MIDSTLASDLLLGLIGVIALVGGVGTVLAFWGMGRTSYRKD
ncbi:hypothetical protein [Microbacterium sp. CJ88]